MISEGARGGTVGFLRVKIDDVTKEDVVIWGFEPMRDGPDAEGGVRGNAEETGGIKASNWRQIT